MTNEPQFRVGLPDHDTPIGAALGRFFSQASNVDFCLIMCFATALGHGKDLDAANAIFGHIINVSGRIDILESAIEKAHVDTYMHDVIKSICPVLRVANARRNDYAHGVIESDETGQHVRLRTWPLQHKRKSSTELLSVKRINGDTLMLQMLAQVGLFVLGNISRDRLQPWLDKLQSAPVDHPQKG